jgi:hypothetical protein
VIEAWQAALEQSGLPIAQLDAAGRPRIAFGAPLQAAAEGEAELAEIFLAQRVPAWRVREGLQGRLPTGHALLWAEDVWLGAPPLPGRVIAADWRLELKASDVDPARLAAAADRLLAARNLVRTRSKGGVDKAYDLRPLLDDVQIVDAAAYVPLAIRIRTRFVPELGAGRPEEVAAALGSECGFELVLARIVRERLILAGERPPRGGR